MMFDEMLHSTVPVGFSSCHKRKTSFYKDIVNTARITSPFMMLMKTLLVIAVIHAMHSGLYSSAYYHMAFNDLMPAQQEQQPDVWQQIAAAGNGAS